MEQLSVWVGVEGQITWTGEKSEGIWRMAEEWQQRKDSCRFMCLNLKSSKEMPLSTSSLTLCLKQNLSKPLHTINCCTDHNIHIQSLVWCFWELLKNLILKFKTYLSSFNLNTFNYFHFLFHTGWFGGAPGGCRYLSITQTLFLPSKTSMEKYIYKSLENTSWKKYFKPIVWWPTYIR